jgi:hypothetical protein
MLTAARAFGHDPITTNLTWTNEISRLIYRHCANCHREGGMAMPLMTYQQARPWAKAIRNEVLARRMPPFDPVKGVGEFRDDPSLTQPEIELFVAWVEGGAPEGATALAMQPALAQAAGPSCEGARVRVRSSWVLAHPVTLCGIYADGPLEVTALLPDESVRRLIWIRDFHVQWNRLYEFQSPQVLPGGTRILVNSPKGAAARLLITR